MDPLVGKRLASYEVLSRVARGGMGVVYRARHVYIDRIVALKVLDPALAVRKDLIERFRTEAQSLARVEHENVIKVIDILEDKGSHFIVMDFAEGVNLRVLVKEKGPLSPVELLSVARQSADALYAAHKQGILHRDIKPENLILSARGRCKLTDFGLAGDLRLIAEGHEGPLNFGTPAYAAPEVLRRMTPDVRSDIFSWGATMYHLASNDPPFGATGSQQIQLRQKQGAELLEARRPDLPRSLCALIQDCLAFHPAERPADFREVLERLPKRVHASSPDTASPTTGLLTSTVPTEPADVARPAQLRHMAGGFSALLALVAIVVLAAVIYLKWSASEPGPGANTANLVPANLPPSPANRALPENRPVANTAPVDGGSRFTPEEDAFSAAELESRAALDKADYKRAFDAWQGFLNQHPAGRLANRANTAREEITQRVHDRRETEFRNSEAAATKALKETRTADALSVWDRFAPELLVALYSGESDSLIERIETQKKAIMTRESGDLALLLEKAEKLRDGDKLLDERALLDGFLAGRIAGTQEKVQARLTRLRQLLEARHQRSVELVESQRKLNGPLRAQSARRITLGIEAMSVEVTNRRWEKVAEGLTVLAGDCPDLLLDRLIDEYARDTALAAKAERALPEALEKQRRRADDIEIKVHNTVAEDGTRSGRIDTYTGKISGTKSGEFSMIETGGIARTFKITQLNAATVRLLLKEGSLDERAALVAWLFALGKSAEAKSELAKLTKLSGLSDAVAVQLANIDSTGQLGSVPMRLLRFFAAREDASMASDFASLYGEAAIETRLLVAQSGVARGEVEAAGRYLALSREVAESDLIGPAVYASALSIAVSITDVELRRWVELESWKPVGKSQREPYNPDALVKLAEFYQAQGSGAEARRWASLALTLDASNEAAWRIQKS